MFEQEPKSQGWLSDDAFRQVVMHTPLVSMDFVVTNAQGEWLLGQRVNRPAQGSWFVPGGRVCKGETLEAAARRLTLSELGHACQLSGMRFLGVYQHFYADSMLDPKCSTHYVVLAYQLTLSLDIEALPREQHDRYAWWPAHAVLHDEMVHVNTRSYLSAVQS